MKGSTGGLTLASIFNELVTKPNIRLDFHDQFNRGGIDADLWTATLDGTGAWDFIIGFDSLPSAWRLGSGNVIDNDSSIHGAANLKNKAFTPFEIGFTTVTWVTRLLLDSIADISVFFGLLNTTTIDYAQNMTRCAHFFCDPLVNANYNCRTHAAAEEVTDSGVPLDTDFHEFKIVWNRASVLFYIDSVLVATHVTQQPIRPCFSHYLIRTEAAAAKYMRIEELDVVVS